MLARAGSEAGVAGRDFFAPPAWSAVRVAEHARDARIQLQGLPMRGEGGGLLVAEYAAVASQRDGGRAHALERQLAEPAMGEQQAGDGAGHARRDGAAALG